MSADDRQSDLAVMDANEFKQKRRLKRILNARQKVEEKADEAEELYVTGKINEDGRNTLVLRAVREYVRQCWNLLIEHVNSKGEDESLPYFADRTLGHIEFEQEGERIEISGLYDYLNCQTVWVETWIETVEYPQGPDDEQERSTTHSVPLQISWRAFLTLNEFLADVHDLEVRFEEMDQTLPSFGFSTMDVSEEDRRVIEEIGEEYDLDVDMRALDQQEAENGSH